MRRSPWMTACVVMTLAGAAYGQSPAPAKPASTPSQPPTGSQPKRPEEVPSFKPGQIDLRPKFRAGQTIRYVFEQNALNQIKPVDSGGGEEATEQKQSNRIGLVMKVIESGEQGATIQVVYETIKVSLDSNGEKAEFDSTKPKPAALAPKTTQPKPAPGRPAPPGSPSKTPTQTDPDEMPGIPDALKRMADLDMSGILTQMVGPMVGTTITVKTDAKGAITSVTGGEGLSGGMGGMGGLGGMMGGGGGGGGLLPSPTQMANWLVAGIGGPGNSGFARVGETWTNNDTLSGTPVGAFRMVTTHTLRSVSAGMANVGFVGRVEAPSENGEPGGGGGGGGGLAQVQNAAYSGTYAWDTRAGALSEMGTDMKVSMDAGMGGSKMRMTSQSQVKVKRQ